MRETIVSSGVNSQRRHSSSFERRSEGGATSPTLRLGRQQRTEFSTPFAYESVIGALDFGQLDVRSPSEVGSTHIQLNRVPRNTPMLDTADADLHRINNSVYLTDHDPERVAVTPSHYSNLLNSTTTTSKSLSSFDEGNEVMHLLNLRPWSLPQSKTHIMENCDITRTKSQLDFVIPGNGSLAMDSNKHISHKERTNEFSISKDRCFKGVNIVESPPTALVGIRAWGHYEDNGLTGSHGKPDIKRSIFLAALFTGVAIVIGTLFTRKDKDL
eukprot:g1387.t1